MRFSSRSFSQLLRPRSQTLALLDDQRAEYIGLVGQDTFPAAVLPPQDVSLDLFARKGLMFERTREREMKRYSCDIAIDAYSGIRQVRLIGLSRKVARLDRSADAFPVVESAITVDNCPVRVQQAADSIGIVGPHRLREFFFRRECIFFGWAVIGRAGCSPGGVDREHPCRCDQ